MSKTFFEVKGNYVQRLEVGTEKLLEERFFNEAGRLDRKGDQPAAIIYNRSTGEPLIREWYRDGKKHRENGPALIHPMPGRNRLIKEWWFDDVHHRWEDHPARTEERLDSGMLLKAEFFYQGQLHRPRDQGPAVVQYDPETGQATNFQSWEEGQRFPTSSKINDTERPPSP